MQQSPILGIVELRYLGGRVNPGEVSAAMDWQGAWYGSLAGRPALVLVAATSTSKEFGTLRVADGSLKAFGTGLGLTTGRRTGRAGLTSAPLEVIKVPVGLSVRHVGRGDQALVAYLPATRVHGDAPREGGELIVMISRLAPTRFRSLGELIRDQQGLVPRGNAEFTPLLFDGPSRYSYVGSWGQAPTCPEFASSVIIDQSVLVDAERAVTRPDRSPSDLLDLRSHLKWIRELDSVPGFALGECQEGPGGASATRRLRAHWTAWLSTDPLTVSIEEVRERADAYLGDPAFHKLGEDGDRVGGRPLSMLNYLSVLEAARLYRPLHDGRFRADERVAAWRAWVDRMNEFAGFSAHAAFVIGELILDRGPNSITAAALLKVHRRRPPNLNELRGAAYDLLYATICDMAQARELDGYQDKTYLVTADKPLAQFRARVELVGQIESEDHRVGLLAVDQPHYMEHYSAGQRRELAEVNTRRELGTMSRLMQSPHADVQQELISQRISALEESLVGEGIASP